MTIDLTTITPILIGALLVWGILRRVRRSFGRQPLQVGRIWLRIGMLTLAGGLVSATSVARNAETLEALTAGLACGAALAYIGLRHTKFEVTPEGRFYTPHTYIGLAVTALFLGRLLCRSFYLTYGANSVIGANQNFAATYKGNRLTLGIFAVLIGYYVLFYAGLLVRNRTAVLPMDDGASPGA